jgi:hypothetical protein
VQGVARVLRATAGFDRPVGEWVASGSIMVLIHRRLYNLREFFLGDPVASFINFESLAWTRLAPTCHQRKHAWYMNIWMPSMVPRRTMSMSIPSIVPPIVLIFPQWLLGAHQRLQILESAIFADDLTSFNIFAGLSHQRQPRRHLGPEFTFVLTTCLSINAGRELITIY